MALVKVEVLQSEIRRRFAGVRGSSRGSKRRYYPSELHDLIRRAADQGVRQGELQQLAGVSASTVSRWISGCRNSKGSVGAGPKPRRLEVVGPVVSEKPRAAAVVVRLSSGVTLELSSEQLTRELLLVLSTLEVSHASPR